jgi:protocatechuate 4,5-dioxygenase alpha subunit
VIADTTIFDLRLSRRGYRLNKMCAALCSPAEREAFKRDEEAFMARFHLTEEEKQLIRRRDFAGLIEHGMNIYAMLKVGSATGMSLYRMGAQMRGESYEQFLATRNIKDAV